jgi:hypothetical protein
MLATKPSPYPYLPPVVRTILDICRFEQGPQQLPVSITLLGISCFGYVIARIGVALFTLPPRLAVPTGLIDAALLTLTVVLALRLRHLSPRSTQTLSGCYAVGSVVGLLTVAAYTLVSLAPEPLLVLGVGHALTFPLILWNLTINTYILRQALSTTIAMAFLLALGYLVLLWQLTEQLAKGMLAP